MISFKKNYSESPQIFIAGWALLSISILALDIWIPLGVADGILYVALVLAGLLTGDRKLIIWGAVLGSIFIVAGFFLSPEGGEMWKILLNRFICLFTLWMTAVLCLLQNQSENQLADTHVRLEEGVRDRTHQLNLANELLRRESSFVQLHKDIAVASNETRAVEDTLQFCLKRICGFAGWPLGHLYLMDPESDSKLVSSTIWHLDNPEQFETLRRISETTAFAPGVGLPGRVLESGKPAWIMDVDEDDNFPRAKLTTDLGIKAAFAFPVLIGDQVAGIMEFFSARPVPPDNVLLEIMAQIGTQLGRVLERKSADDLKENSRQRLRNLYHRLEMVREEERTRIAREIHDEMAQVLTTLKLELTLLGNKLHAQGGPLSTQAKSMIDVIDDTIPAVKQMIHDLRPPVLDDLGLDEAIHWQGQEFERLTGIHFNFQLPKSSFQLDKARSTTLFRIFQETITNVIRHAGAKNILVQLNDNNDRVSLLVQDDGKGIAPAQHLNGHSLGILGMRERARVWGGTVEFDSEPQQGTTVTISISKN